MKKILYILMLGLALAGCKKQPYLDVDKTSINLLSSGGSEQITVSANYPWTATASDSWISIKYTEGENLLKVTVGTNNNTESRRGTITIKSEGLTVSVPVAQNQRDVIVLETSGRVRIGREAQQVEVQLQSNVEDMTVTVDEGSDWVSVVSTKAVTARKITLAVKANDARERQARVSFSDKTGTVKQQISINQDGVPRIVRVTFQDVPRFRVPELEGTGTPGEALSAYIFWDGATQGTPYDASLSKVYDFASGSLRIEAQRVGLITFDDVDGLVSIDLSDF
ncbi:MAG: BACON domain-containing protein [Bacteroidales bacterium]|nr:BACON domain-containing protein [Bacteroidales bacterium]